MITFKQRTEKYLQNLREERNYLLQQSDWTQLPDAPINNPQAWLDYRRALRDTNFQTLDLENPQWPKKPE